MQDIKIGDKVLVKDLTYEGEAKVVSVDNNAITIAWGKYKATYKPDELIIMTPEIRQKHALIIEDIQHDLAKAASLLETAWSLFDKARQLHLSENIPTDLREMDIEDFEIAAGKFGWSSSSLHC